MTDNKMYCRFCEKKSSQCYTEDSLFQVICNNCSCHSPIRSTEAGAIRAWISMNGISRNRDKKS
jgi:hypothetical protein